MAFKRSCFILIAMKYKTSVRIPLTPLHFFLSHKNSRYYPQLFQTFRHFLCNGGAFLVFRPCSCNKDQVPIAVESFVLKHRLISGSDNPTGAVAFDGISDLLACSHSDTADTAAVFHRVDHDGGSRKGFAPVIKTQKILVLI